MSNKILNDADNIREQIAEQLTILFAGTDKDGSQIFKVQRGRYDPLNTLGFGAVGSGTDPAHSELIYSSYNKSCNREDAMLAVTRARESSKDAQGVGSRTDIYDIGEAVEQVDHDTVKKYQRVHAKIEKKKGKVKQSAIEEAFETEG